MPSLTSAKVQRSPSKSGVGILSRLKRISRKEKRAATLDDADYIEEPFVMVSREPSIKVEKGSTSPVERSRQSGRQMDMAMRDFAQERMPIFGDQRVQSIHSVQPSLVDDQSIMERQSPSDSLLELDEEETWEDPDPMPVTPVETDVPSKSTLKLAGQSHAGEEEEDWHMQNVPGSFFAGPHSMKDGGGLSLTGMDRSTPSTPSTPKLDETSASSQTPTQNSAATFTETHIRLRPHQRPTEYLEALSRQPSDSSLVPHPDAGDNTLIAGKVEEGAQTPRAGDWQEKESYFTATPAAARSSPVPNSSKHINPPRQDQIWLRNAHLAPEERHYLVRFMATKQVVWEMERLFLLRSADDLDHCSASQSLPKSDMAYIRSAPGAFVPDMPVTRLILRHVLMTCPVFSAAIPIEGAAAQRTRNAGAIRFFNEGILPLAQFVHEHSLSRPVDLNGEWPSELFDAPSTLGVMQSSCVKLLARYVTAIVDGRGHGFLWTKVPSPTAYDYIGHRTTLNKLKQGGMEVNVVGCRLRPTSRECEFIVSVRRYGFPPAYVIRTESDFYDFARTLAEELGPQVRVRAVPAPDVDMSSLFAAATANEDPETASNSSAGTGSKSSSVPSSGAPMVKSLSSRSREPFGDATSDSANNSLFDLSANRSSASLAGSMKAARRRSVESALGSRQDLSPRIFAPRAYMGNGGSTDLTAAGRSTPITTDEEARRKQMRSWLRDTLSIRGAGHAQQTRAFLQNDSFTDREMKQASRKDVLSRLEVDEVSKQERERTFGQASREVYDLRAEMIDLWKQCVEADGVEQALKAVKANDTFSTLPLTYQRFISWTNLQIADFIHHVFVDSHEAKANFERLQQLVNAIPWRMLSIALRERTGMMMQMIQKCMSDGAVYEKLAATVLQDGPASKIAEELANLKKRLGKTVIKKLQAFASATQFQKAVVRQAARQAGIPLVAAIMRGSDKPLLAAEGMKKVVSATRVYQDFMSTQPSYAEMRAKLKANVDVRLIYDMQRALRLACHQRDGQIIRQGLEKELKGAVEALTEPLIGLLKRLHRGKQLVRQRSTSGSLRSGAGVADQMQDVVVELQQFCMKLLDVLAGLRARVQDPWRSLSTLTLLLDDAVPTWYRMVHISATSDTLIQDLAVWIQGMAGLLRFRNGEDGDDLLNRFWTNDKQDHAPFSRGKGEDRAALESMVEANWRKRSRQLETACRWVAGETDADMDVQLIGEGGKTRMTRYEMPKINLGPEPRAESALLPLLAGFRSALGRVLDTDPGTAW
jgi:hypothetical protein